MSTTELIAEAREYADAVQGGENENWMRLVTFVDSMADALEAAEKKLVDARRDQIEKDAVIADRVKGSHYPGTMGWASGERVATAIRAQLEVQP